MTILQRIIGFFRPSKPEPSKPAARFEGGQRWSDKRSYLPGYLQDARIDADKATREEMVRKHRYFERNNALLQKLADLFEQFTVGANGLHVTAASSEPEWNRNSGVAWDAWCEFPDLTSRQPFGTIQSLIARRWFIDGEAFIQLTRGRDEKGFRPRIQLIEAHRVKTPTSMAPLEGKSVVDGVAIDDRGRPIGYWVQNSFKGDVFELVPADQMIHVFEPSRPGEYRGIIFGHAVLNDLHDLDDLQLLEMDAAKENAKVSRVIETANGELSEDEVQRGTDEQVAADSGDITAIRRWYKETFGGEVEVMMRGDKYHQHAGERPSVVTQGYWDYLCSKICAGYGISKLLVYPWTLQGTVTRMDLDAQAGFFRSRSAVIASAVRRIWIWVMQWEKSNNRDLADPPADWTRINIRPPRSVNVDVGRNSSALIAEYEAGLSTLDDIYGPGGFDYREKMRQRAIEFAEARDLEREFKLPAGTLIKSTLEVLKANQPKPELKQLPAPEPEPAAP